MKTYEEFKKYWYGGLPEGNILLKHFCDCDYKRYTGEWKETIKEIEA